MFPKPADVSGRHFARRVHPRRCFPAPDDLASQWLRAVLNAGATPRISVAVDDYGTGLAAQLLGEDEYDQEDEDEDEDD